MASFATQYGIRLQVDDMNFREFRYLLSGLNGDTPLGQIVSIRSETKAERLKEFSAHERRIRNKWIAKTIKMPTKEEQLANAAAIAKAFKAMQ